MRRVFLDHQSGTPVAAEVFEAMKPYFTEKFGNPASLHQHGLEARDALAKAREQAASLINADSPDEIIFTSGGTEAANLAVKGTAYAHRRRGNHLIVSAVEHPAVLHSADFLEKEGFNVTRLPVDARGVVAPEAVRDAITDTTTLICVQHVNHDIGTIQQLTEIGQIANDRGVTLFVDAVASAGWIPIDVQALGGTLLSFSPHRFYGPKGVGVLYRQRRARLGSLIHGGVQEGGRRAGTENMPAIVGAGAAAELAIRGLPTRVETTTRLQRRLWEGLEQKVAHVKLNGPALGPGRIGTNLNVSTEFIEGEGAALLCDLRGVAVASGAACVSKTLRPSHVLVAIGLDIALAQANVIFSLADTNTDSEIDHVLEVFPEVVTRLRSLSPTWQSFVKNSS
jgi:cysteine desulfurase